MGVGPGRDPMHPHTSPVRGLALCRGTQVAGGWAAPRGLPSQVPWPHSCLLQGFTLPLFIDD